MRTHLLVSAMLATALVGLASAATPLQRTTDPLPTVPGLSADYLDGRDSATFANRSHDHDDRYYTEAESDARFLGINAKAADSERVDGLDSSQLLRSDTSGRVAGTLVVERLGIARDSPEATLHMVGGGPSLRMDNSDPNGGSWWLRHNGGSSEFVIGNTADFNDGNIKLRVNEQGDLTVVGHIYAHAGSHVGDVAEPVAGAVAPGDLVVADGFTPEGKLRVARASAGYDPGVVGVVSTSPSLRLAGLPTDAPLAVAGIVPVKVTGFVPRGALLVSSDVPGHAMACREAAACFGSVVGKSLEEHPGGQGQIRALISLG